MNWASVKKRLTEGNKRSVKDFHYDLAKKVFGDEYMKNDVIVRQKRSQVFIHEDLPEVFQGDWFQLAFLLRCHETKIEKRIIDEQHHCGCDFCCNKWCDIFHFEHARLNDVDLEKVRFLKAHLENAWLINANLKNAWLSNATLENANLCGANLEKALLMETNLKNAILSGANLTGAQLKHANLNGADVRGATGIIFDSNRVDRLRIEGKAPDPWSVLRRNYTGPRFFIHILLLVAFLLPYIGKAIVLTSISNGMVLIDKTLSAIPTDISTDTLLKKKAAVWILMGFTNDNNIIITFYFVIIAWMMIAYNIFRYILATKVSDLREAEDRSKITPAKKEYLGLYRLHRIANVFMYIGYGSLIIQIVRWLWVTQIPTY